MGLAAGIHVIFALNLMRPRDRGRLKVSTVLFFSTVALVWGAVIGLQSSVASSPIQAPPAKQGPPATVVVTRPTAPQTGYAGNAACIECHAEQEASIKNTQHWLTKNPRAPVASTGCENCHGPGQAHIDDDAKGKIAKLKALKPAELNETCLSCHNRGVHAGWEGSAHERRNLSCATCHSVHSPKSPERQLVKPTETQVCATCHRLQVTKTERAVAHMPVREGKMSCSSCHNPHGSITNVKNLKTGSSVAELCTTLSYRDARPDALRARAGARELRDVPRPARVLQRPDARGPHADALPALPHREQAPGDALRQGPDHRQQEQPDVRHGRA